MPCSPSRGCAKGGRVQKIYFGALLVILTDTVLVYFMGILPLGAQLVVKEEMDTCFFIPPIFPTNCMTPFYLLT